MAMQFNQLINQSGKVEHCSPVNPIPVDCMMVARHFSILRGECIYDDGGALATSRPSNVAKRHCPSRHTVHRCTLTMVRKVDRNRPYR